MTGSHTHRVYCFDCKVRYEQSGPHPHRCGSCGSREIGVHSEPTGEVWRITLVGPDGPKESHEIMRSGVGEMVQALIAVELQPNEAVVVTPPEIDGTPSEASVAG
jgi:hypothetical protein